MKRFSAQLLLPTVRMLRSQQRKIAILERSGRRRRRAILCAFGACIAIACLAPVGQLVSALGARTSTPVEVQPPSPTTAEPLREFPETTCWSWLEEQSIEAVLAGKDLHVQRQVCYHDYDWREPIPKGVPSYATPEGGCFGPRTSIFAFQL